MVKDVDDPIIMYLVVRKSLSMSIGKTAAQVAHAAQKLQEKYSDLSSKADSYIDPIYGSGGENIPKSLIEKLKIFDDWNASGIRKVILEADEKEWIKLKDFIHNENIEHYMIVDLGLTELETNTETVIGLWPIVKNNSPKLIKRLQLLR